MVEKGIVKVCFVSPKAYPLFDREVDSIFGGAEVDLYLLATELAKDNAFEVSFIVADYGQSSEQMLEGVRVLKSLDFNENSIIGAVRIWRVLKKADADIYFQETASPGTFLVALFCKVHNRRFVYRTAHQRECDGTYLKENIISGKLFKWALKRAGQVVSQNESDRRNLKATVGVDSEVIPNAQRLDEISKNDREFVLWVGRSIEFKRPDRFLRLAEKVPDENFVMICQQATGDDNYDQLQSAASKIANLKFIESVDFHQIDDYFRRAKVLVSTSDAEGFPNVFVQACKCATCIVSLTVNPDEFLDKYNCGLSCGGNEEMLAEKLSQVLKDGRYIELGRNALKYAEETHDINIICPHYKSVFNRLQNS